MLVVGSLPIVAGQELPEESYPSSIYYKYNDPFKRDLDTYKHRMNVGNVMLVMGMITLITGPILGTVSKTLEGRGRIPSTLATPLNYTSYSLISIGSGLSLTGLFMWKKNSEKYYETLRIQTQYYNLITQ